MAITPEGQSPSKPFQAPEALRFLLLEARLEHAPVPLFNMTPANMEPLNASARRLLAPGRVTDTVPLHAALAGLSVGSRTLVQFDSEHGTERALAVRNVLTVDGAPQSLVALLPLENELSAEATQAWCKLVHVLTHEIMNSLTPVASLSQTSRTLLAEAAGALAPDLAADLDVALDAISRRAESLGHFVSHYRMLASLPRPQPQRFLVKDLFARLSALVAPGWQARGGKATFVVASSTLSLRADSGQIEQALVNLLQNAVDATAASLAPQVSVDAHFTTGGRLRIDVRDNGHGIPDGVAAEIFTPFFSTKKQGGGIGLAMVRQLIQLNGGTVRYARPINDGAHFIITF
ncbi:MULTISPECIES: PAS domain-containing sensor histidine kinase [unclassified Janthinobacterium]|uniref:sensor histidine kinase n=1 Tax=unclassified Janthinobacterium TaxID=2610881 RepID=UPI001E3FD346|nr:MULTISPECIES: sensor histidine kinase [unclassified Janthinobacterium]